MIVTVVCRCGEPNAVPDEILESAVCERCTAYLLRLPSAAALSLAASVVGAPGPVAPHPHLVPSGAGARRGRPALVAS
jgi:hypothetical protein